MDRPACHGVWGMKLIWSRLAGKETLVRDSKGDVNEKNGETKTSVSDD